MFVHWFETSAPQDIFHAPILLRSVSIENESTIDPFYIKVVDDKYVNDSTTPNNVVEEVFYVAIDDGQPKLTLNNASGQFVGERFEISGKVLDENGIECIHLQSKESSSIYTSLVLGKGLNDDGTFEDENKG